ncbi:MAG TPA: DMT family transporter [Bryobacteraceae bacterium]|jgi:drug/metabolite transporter (DMT)-like permease|nr:DMT family transporter [Bryobacteraceae bacterium]
MATNASAVAAGPNHKLGLGVSLIITAFLCSAVMSSFGKELSNVPPTLTLFWQYFISFAVFVPTAFRTGRASLKTDHLTLQIVRSLAGSICQLLFFIAVKSIPLMDSVLLSNAAPLFIPFIVYFWFRKTVQPLVWLSLLIGLAGIVLIIKPGPQMFHNPASLIALVSGIFSALALVSTNKLADTEPPNRILLYNFGISTVLLIPVCIWSWRPLRSREVLLLLGVGGFYALTQYFIIRAYHYATAAELSPFNYSVVVFSGLLGWWLFGTVPDGIAILGTILICAGGILSISAGHKEGRGHPFGSGHWRFRWKFPHAWRAART